MINNAILGVIAGSQIALGPPPAPPGSPPGTTAYMQPLDWVITTPTSSQRTVSISGDYRNGGGFLLQNIWPAANIPIDSGAIITTLTKDQLQTALGFMPTKVVAMIEYGPSPAGQQARTYIQFATLTLSPLLGNTSTAPPASGTLGVASLAALSGSSKVSMTLGRSADVSGVVDKWTRCSFLGFAP